MMTKRRHFYVMEWMFCEQEIYSSPPNSSLQQTCSNGLVLLSFMYKKARDTLLHPSDSQFTERRKRVQTQLNCTLIIIKKKKMWKSERRHLCSKIALQERNLLTVTIYSNRSSDFLLPFLTLLNTNTNALLCILTEDKSDVVLLKKKTNMERLRQFTAVLMHSLQSMIGDQYLNLAWYHKTINKLLSSCTRGDGYS